LSDRELFNMTQAVQMMESCFFCWLTSGTCFFSKHQHFFNQILWWV